MGVRTHTYIHHCSGTSFPILLTCSESKLGRSWQGVGAACQALQTREVVKHKHFGVYPRDLHGVAAEGCTSAVALPLPAACEREGSAGLSVHPWLSVRPSIPALPRLSTAVLDALPATRRGVFWSMAEEQVCFPPSRALK